MNVGAAPVSNGEAPELGEPSQRPPHLPAMPSKPFAAVDAASCDAREDPGDPICAALMATSAVAVTFVGVAFLQAPVGTTVGAAHPHTASSVGASVWLSW